MDKIEFRKLLFKVAFCTMACDGHIDKREIEEIQVMDNNTSFFSDVDLSGELSDLVSELGTKGAGLFEELFSTLRNSTLRPMQELLVLEVALRIINSDNKIDENEKKFLYLVRACLEIHNESIIDRFGDLSILGLSNKSKDAVSDSSYKIFAESIILPEMDQFNDAVLNIDDSTT